MQNKTNYIMKPAAQNWNCAAGLRCFMVLFFGVYLGFTLNLVRSFAPSLYFSCSERYARTGLLPAADRIFGKEFSCAETF